MSPGLGAQELQSASPLLFGQYFKKPRVETAIFCQGHPTPTLKLHVEVIPQGGSSNNGGTSCTRPRKRTVLETLGNSLTRGEVYTHPSLFSHLPDLHIVGHIEHKLAGNYPGQVGAECGNWLQDGIPAGAIIRQEASSHREGRGVRAGRDSEHARQWIFIKHSRSWGPCGS